jgi:hypothetical protein
MAKMKIDVTAIEGFEEMDAEKKLEALMAHELDVPDSDSSKEDYIRRLKEANTKATHEAAEWKRKHTALLSEEDKKKVEAETKAAEIEAELKELKTTTAIAEHKASLIALGYEEKLAHEMSEALVNGDIKKAIADHTKFLELRDAAAKKEAVKKTPRPDPEDVTEQPMTKEKFGNLEYAEAVKFKAENPEAYEAFSKGD